MVWERLMHHEIKSVFGSACAHDRRAGGCRVGRVSRSGRRRQADCTEPRFDLDVDWPVGDPGFDDPDDERPGDDRPGNV